MKPTRFGKLMLTAVLFSAFVLGWTGWRIYTESAVPYSNDAEYLEASR